MKKYKAVIKTTQEWTKDIKIPDDVEDIRDYVNDHFHETHYNNVLVVSYYPFCSLACMSIISYSSGTTKTLFLFKRNDTTI